MDQAESSTPGRPLTYSGKTNTNKVSIITLFVDSISIKLFAESQENTGAKETLVAKYSIEREAKTCGISIKAFRKDNGIFKAVVFKADLTNHDQSITYCGVGAHHQNGVIERNMKNMVEKELFYLMPIHVGIVPSKWSYGLMFSDML